MPAPDTTAEWCLLQNQYDSYEKYSLLIKLLAVTLFSIGLMTDRLDLWFAFVVLTFWLQDAIWKTFQARIEARLLQLEAVMAPDSGAPASPFPATAYQFHSNYLQSRARGPAIIAEYLGQALRPTVAYPYLLLMLLLAARLLFA